MFCQRAGKLTDLYQITYHSVEVNPAHTILFPKKESMDFVPVFGKFLSLPYEKLLSLPPVTIFANSFVS